MNVGIDLTYIPRFKDKDALAKKILSQNELIEYNSSVKKDEYLASRFFVKESFLKSIKHGVLYFDLKTIVIVKEKSGAIHVEFNGEKYNASLSHEMDYCVGVVLHD